MGGFLLAALAVTLLAVLAILFTGVIGLARGGEFNRKYGNKLMRLRVLLQFLALGIIVLLFLSSGR
jgi:hypothetical protein